MGNASKKPEPKKPATKPAAKGSAGPRPNDDPIAAIAASQQPDYDFTFDAEGLDADVSKGATKEAAVEVFASEVHANMQETSVSRIKAIDPMFITSIIQAVMAIIQTCSKKNVTQALDTCEKHPKSLQARFVRLSLARRLPGHWTQDALEAARAMIDTGIKNKNTDLFNAIYPESAQDEGPVAAAGAEVPAPQ